MTIGYQLSLSGEGVAGSGPAKLLATSQRSVETPVALNATWYAASTSYQRSSSTSSAIAGDLATKTTSAVNVGEFAERAVRVIAWAASIGTPGGIDTVTVIVRSAQASIVMEVSESDTLQPDDCAANVKVSLPPISAILRRRTVVVTVLPAGPTSTSSAAASVMPAALRGEAKYASVRDITSRRVAALAIASSPKARYAARYGRHNPTVCPASLPFA